MADSQEPESDQQSPRRVPRWLGVGLVMGSVLVVAGVGAAWRGWVWVQHNLTPWLETELSEALNRPVELGELERLTLSGLRVGASQIPATATDPDSLALRAVEVQINPRDLLRRELRLNVVLEQVELYLEQAADGQWVALDIDLPEREDPDREPWLDIQPGTIRLNDGRVTLVPYDQRQRLTSQTNDDRQPRVELTDVQSQVQFSQVPVDGLTASGQPRTAQHLDLELSGRSVGGGAVNLKGAVQLPVALAEPDPLAEPNPSAKTDPSAEPDPPTAQPLRANLNVRTQAARATDILPLVESFLDGPLPVQFPTGTVSGSVDIKLGEAPATFIGTARVKEGTVITPGLPEPLQDLQGDVQFQGRALEFEDVTARLGDLTAQAGGRLDFKTGYDFAGRVNPFTVAQISELFEFELPVAAAGTFAADVTMTGPLNKPVITTELASQDQVLIDQVAFAEIQTKTTLKAPNLVIDSFRAIPQAGGSLSGNGLFTFGSPARLALAVTGDRLPGDALGRLYGLPDNLALGPIFFTANLAGPLDQLTAKARWRAPSGTYPAQGTIALANNQVNFTDTFVQVAGGTVAGQGTLGLDSRRWETNLRATGVQLAQLGAGVAGVVNGEAQVVGSLDHATLSGLQGQGVAQAVLAEGVVNSRANLSQGRWTADVQGNGLSLAAFSPNLQGRGSGQFRFAGTTENLSWAGMQGQGQLVLSDGLATAATVAPQLATVRQPLTADLAWNGQSIVVEQASTAGIRANGLVTPWLSGPAAPGIAHVDLNLNASRFNLAALPIPGQLLPVQGFGSFDGRLAGSPRTLILTGEARLDNLAVSELAFATPLTGPVFFSQADGLTVDLREPSQRVEGDRLYATTRQGDYDLEFLVRSGTALAEGHTQGSDFYATIANLPLDDLRLPQGGIEGVGTLSGTVESAVIRGNWREPNLRASFDIVDPGLGYISLRTVAPEAQPGDDPAQPLPEMPASTQVRYGRLRGTLGYANNVISLVGGELITASEESRYLLSGTYALDGSQRVNGKLMVKNGQIQDILLTLKIFELSDFRLNPLQPPDWYRPITEAELAALETTQVGDRYATLLDQLRRFAEVQALEDILLAQADANLFPPLEGLQGSFSGTVTAHGALPRDVRIEVDMAGANWLWKDPTHPTGIAYRLDDIIAKATYQDDVLRLSPISLHSTFASHDPNAPTLALAELNGEVSLDAADPVDRTLRLNIADVPIEAVRRPLRIPSNFGGFINAGASLTGSLDDPLVRGRLAVNDATINRQPIDVAAADFIYQEARLNLRSNVAIKDQVDPLTLLASVPLPLAGNKQVPSSDAVTVRLRMKDQGFALVNLFTQAITWETGTAELALNVDGRWPVNKPFEDALTSLVVTGAANFDGVTLSSRSLPEPLTNIQGDIVVLEGQGNGGNNSLYFNGLSLDFQNLQGDFSAGQVLADGQLKIVPSINDLFPGVVGPSPFGTAPADPDTDPPAPRDDRFRLTLDNIALDLRNPKGTYTGKLDGEMMVGGSLYLLEPLLYGNIRLSNGIITLPESQAENGTVSGGGGFGNASPSIYRPLPPVLEDVSVTLAENVRLTIPSIVNVNATGTLDLVGTVPDIKPNGRITMPSGRINLLTTEFRLTGNENYAEFSALDDRIDPYLVANLSAAVSDSVGGTSLTAATPFPRNEINDAAITQLGLTQNGVQTVRIRASVNGRASRVIQLQGVELESTPPRSESEIITLISSEFLTALESTLGSVSGGGDSFQGLLAFVGSALLNRLQGVIGAGLENTELRLYSASPPGSQQVDVGGELGFNLSPSISISVQKVFTNITPALFSVRYRINDQFTLRGVTSYEEFNENTGAILEFRL